MSTHEEGPRRIVAAGGVVWRTSRRGPEVAVVYRGRHKDWTLPKGKVKPEETCLHAALREVREETGCEAVPREFAEEIHYASGDVPKTVLFWSMDLAKDGGFRPSEEVAELRWLPVEAALERLSHPGERRVLEASAAQSVKALPSSLLLRGRKRLRRWYDAGGRLASDIAGLRAEVATRVQNCPGRCSLAVLGPGRRGVCAIPWQEATCGLLAQAEQCREDGAVQQGWCCLHAAQCQALRGLHTDAEIRAKAEPLLEEALQKLSPWRQKTVRHLLAQEAMRPGHSTPETMLRDGLTPDELCEAKSVLVEWYNTEWRKAVSLKRQLVFMGVSGAAAAVAATWLVLPELLMGSQVSGRALAWASLCYGTMGAAISSFLSLAKLSRAGSRYSEQGVITWLNLARLGVGAGAAVAVCAFLASGVLRIGESASTAPGLVLAVSFVSGFSERLLVRAVDVVSGSKPQADVETH